MKGDNSRILKRPMTAKEVFQFVEKESHLPYSKFRSKRVKTSEPFSSENMRM